MVLCQHYRFVCSLSPLSIERHDSVCFLSTHSCPIESCVICSRSGPRPRLACFRWCLREKAETTWVKGAECGTRSGSSAGAAILFSSAVEGFQKNETKVASQRWAALPALSNFPSEVGTHQGSWSWTCGCSRSRLIESAAGLSCGGGCTIRICTALARRILCNRSFNTQTLTSMKETCIDEGEDVFMKGKMYL